VGKEEQIAIRLQQGATPKELLADGFSKSTVYKVAEALRSHQVAAPSPPIVVQLATDQERYLPGQSAHASFRVSNHSGTDLYVFQAGVRPEWIPSTEWMPTVVRRLLGPGNSMVVRLTVPIPADVVLGEKDLYFGLQGQWVGPQSMSPSNELMWTGALILRVQRPRTGARVFLAHSVPSLSLVGQLARTLEDNGIEAIIADADEAASAQAIQNADFLVAVITHPWRMASAAVEITHAKRHAREMILLRDTVLAMATPAPLAELPWADVDFSLGATLVMGQVFDYVTETITRRASARKKERDDARSIILLALGALAAGVVIARGQAST
jgi:hypothetical protein